MKKLLFSLGGASLAMLVLVGATLAAGPWSGSASDQLRDRDRDRDAIPTLLGLSEAQVRDLRQDGLSLAQIAERQKVDPQKLVDALMARWTERIELRLANGALTADRAAELRSQVEVQARNMVYKTTLGGMHGAVVGAGPQAGAMQGTGNGQGDGYHGGGAGPRGAGTGTCDGSGRS